MIGCLFIHGFTGAPYEVDPLANDIKKKTGWLVRVPTLPGHGVTLSLKGHTYNEWVECAEQELLALMDEVDEVYVIGFSMGGVIASYLAAKYEVKKLVLLSAAIYYVNPKQILLDCKEMIKDFWNGNLNQNELYNRYKRKLLETPLRATFEFQKLVKKVKPYLNELTLPVLIIQGECDGIVPVKSAHYLYKTIPSKEKVLRLLPCSKHHVCHGEEYEDLKEYVETFLYEGTKEKLNHPVKVQ
ncbi:alpha/beta hydrolase [Metabacillus sediminilitoris]|jgi:esterase/lipase|uniref:Alpha/beta fold hydrolase n=1 Tax=Metabacillus sediminilitoris TaxID=2567941 RepID=A0A4S4BKZ0_9BACI|nr:alpha/beta fold hydrolase [Metabacillus sediminilitoris]QGQ44066.1 alpha/beta fold hydrolase [Metabacillus sediminilitoris]THF75420.1 alpha/beta fold hydrolase [Metabacillus sediminilitoris]